MKMNKKPYPITTLCAQEKLIDPTPDYQRPPAWSRKQKQLLIDSILREYDIPKMYWESVDRDDGVKFEVIDGQQRLRAIWEFRRGEYPLAKDTDPVQGIQCAGQKYDELDMEISTLFDVYAVDVVIVEDAAKNNEEDEVSDMFLRLQNGTTLKAQEKRNAMPGKMRDFVKTLAGHPFFENCRFSNARFTFDHVTAQMTCLEMIGGPTNIRNSALDRMYRDNTEFDSSGKVAKKVEKVLDYLLEAFPEKTPELEHHSVITLYCLASKLIEGYVFHETGGDLASWFIGFEAKRRKNDELDEDARDSSLVEYKGFTGHSTDSEESIQWRLEYIERLFFSKFPDIEPKDTQRAFSSEQRLAIFRRGDGVCQIAKQCNGEKLSWNDWHADHIKPHSEGGKTVVSNGQIACPACNIAKSNRTL